MNNMPKFHLYPKESGLNWFPWGPLSQCYTQARPDQVHGAQLEPDHNPEGGHGIFPRALSHFSGTAFQLWPLIHTGFSVKRSAMSLWAQKFPQLLIIREKKKCFLVLVWHNSHSLMTLVWHISLFVACYVSGEQSCQLENAHLSECMYLY